MKSKPADEAVVVRGGVQRDATVLLEQVLDNQEVLDLPVLSVHALSPGAGELTNDTIMRICAEAPVRHGKVQTTTVAKLRSLGFAVVKDTSNGQSHTHCHVVFGHHVRQSDLQRFVDAMEGPFINPTRKRKEDETDA